VRSLLQAQANRRQLLTGSACAIAASIASGNLIAAAANAATGVSVLLHDPRFALAADLRQRLQSNRARIIALTGDPVRLWRDELGTLLQARDTRLLGITRWPEFLVIRGLAAESRLHVRYQRVDAAGASVWLIA
jgi:hypothetical protein